jgi:hypothetical protein
MGSKLSRCFCNVFLRLAFHARGITRQGQAKPERQRSLDAAQDDMLAQGGGRGQCAPPPCRRIGAAALSQLLPSSVFLLV